MQSYPVRRGPRPGDAVAKYGAGAPLIHWGAYFVMMQSMFASVTSIASTADPGS